MRGIDPRRRLSTVDAAQTLLERARLLCDPPTHYRLAKELGVSVQRMSNWTRGKHRPDIDALIKLADFLGEDRTAIMAVVLAEQHQGSLRRQFWERLSPRVLPAAVAALVLVGIPSQGRFGNEAQGFDSLNPVYIMRSALEYLRRLLRLAALRAQDAGPWPAPCRG